MARLEAFEAIIKRNEPLAPFTQLRLGGPAEMLVEPRSIEELSQVVRACYENKIPLRVLGCGCNMLIVDEGVSGAVLRLSAPPFTTVTVQGRRVRAGTGTSVSTLIGHAARDNLAGLETLIGIPGTVGGALRINAGDRAGDIGQFVRLVEVLDSRGQIQIRHRDELRFGEHDSNLDDPVLLSVEFDLEPDLADVIVKRMRKAWILRKGAQPLSSQPTCRMFKNPRGRSASTLIEKAGLKHQRVGGAEVSDHDANFVIVHSGATSRDVLCLIDLVRTRVEEKSDVLLEQEITVW
jgi:UDP-N-acetylmuramate dehydrogenase